MSDTSSIDPGTVLGDPKGTIGVTRKVNLGNFESEEVSIFVQFPVTFGDEEATSVAANDAAFLAKSVLYSQLGLEVEVQDGVLRVKSVFPGATVVPSLPPTPQQAIAALPSTAAPSAPAAASAGHSAGASQGDLVCPIPGCGSGMYDNRPKNVERLAAGQKALPEARCRLHKDGCPGIIWNIAKGK